MTYKSLGENERHPDTVALWYIATNRLSILQSLYRVHKQPKVVEFLNHDFSDQRWRDAASKNAYTLLKQKRFCLGASFFLLGEAFEEAFNVCFRQLNDPQLALFLCRVMMIRFKNDVTKFSLFSNYFKNITLNELLPMAVKFHDAWLQSQLLWLNDYYVDAILAMLPEKLRPCLLMKESGQISYSILNSVYSSNVLMRPDHQWYFSKGTTLGPLEVIKDSLVYPLLLTKQTFFASLYRRYLLKNVHVRRSLVTVKQNFPKSPLRSSIASWSHADLDNSNPYIELNSSLMLCKSEHVMPEILCFIVEAMELFISHVEVIDQIFQLVKDLRYPFFTDTKFPCSFHWINMSSFYRMMYDSIYLTHREIWSGACPMLKNCSNNTQVDLTHNPFMTSPMSWCVNHGPHYFIHWLDKTFLHAYKDKNLIKEETPEMTSPVSPFHKMQIEATSRSSSIPSIPFDLHKSLNDYLKRNPRLDVMFTFKNFSFENCISCIFGWTNSLFSLLSELFSIQFHKGTFRFVSNPINQQISSPYALLCCSFLSVAWFHTVRNSLPIHSITRFLALLTTSSNILACTLLLLPSTTEASQSRTLHNETVGQEKKHTNFTIRNETWTTLHALVDIVNDFSQLSVENHSTFIETTHQFLATMMSLIRSKPTYFHQHTSHTAHQGSFKSLASHNLSVSLRRLQLWNGLQDMLLMLLFDYILVILEKTVQAAEACFVTCFQTTNHDFVVGPQTKTSHLSFSNCQDTLQCVLDMFKCLVRSFQNVFFCEYRVSKMTQFILFVTLEFPSFIPRMWPISNSTCSAFTPRPPLENVSNNAEEHCWSTLFKETALVSQQEIDSFSSLWSCLQCSPKLILSLCREPMHYLPDIFTDLLHASLTHLPLNKRVGQIRDPPFSFTVDSTQPLSCLYHVPTLSGNSLSICNAVPVGLSAAITSLSQKSSCNTLFIATKKKNTLINLPRAIYYEYVKSTNSHTFDQHNFSITQPRVPASLNILSHNALSLAAGEKQSHLQGTNEKQCTTGLSNGKTKIQSNGITYLTLPVYEQQIASWIAHSATLYRHKKICSPINIEDSRRASVTGLSVNQNGEIPKNHLELLNTKLTNQLKLGVKRHHMHAKQLIFHTKDSCSTKSANHPVFPVQRENSQVNDHYGIKLCTTEKQLPLPTIFLTFEMFLCGIQTSATHLFNKNIIEETEDILNFSITFINNNLTSYLSNLSEGDHLKENCIIQHIMSKRRNLNTHASYLYLTFLNNILSKIYLKIFKKLEINFLHSSFTPYLKKKSNANFHVSLLINHPFLPIAAGAILLSLKESITHFSTDIIPIIGLWSFYSGEIIGTFSLSTISPRFFSAPSSKTKTNEFHTIQSNAQERVVQIHSHYKQRPHTVFYPFLSKFDSTQNILNTTQLPTYQQAGHIVSLQWSSCGNYLIAAHIKGWVTLWNFIDPNKFITTNATPMNATTQALYSNQTKPSCLPLNDSSFFSTGIKIHNTICRYATLLKNPSTCGDILITSGRGLHNSIVLENKAILSQKKNFYDASCHVSEQNLVCVWEWQLDHLKKKSSHSLPKLCLIDNNFHRNDEPTCFVIWYARHLIIYGTKLGGVRYLNLRPCSKVSDWIIPCSLVIHSTNENEKTTLVTRHDTGLSSKSILKIFLLESTHRLITCYTDATIGIWNMEPLCSFYFSITGSLPQLQPQNKPFITQLKLLSTSASKSSLKFSKKLNTHSSHENFKSSHFAGKIGTVLARSIHGSRHTLIDAHMVAKHHILTLTDDGSIMLTRLL
ncbi:uncharacterized protein LOC128883568 [Hylaeus volcanicus]|uniref:uncharacterized protein LOC128883568 n=1 Tax=Hylaeus volcanicus TaxID=313075 RepID=UPI0023B7B915|nr:uncharacterized protein LOC128883568 [Hylaeus volcanicus]